MNAFILFLALFLTTASAFGQGFSWQKDFETQIDTLMQKQKIPGIAIQVVGPNGPVLQIVKGQRDVKNNLPVTTKTLYAIGSTSKAFTGVLLAQLHSQGLVDFDIPVQKYLPAFAIQDHEASKSLNLRDLMAHRTGVGRHDLAWYHKEKTRAEVLAMIPFLDLSAPPRTTFIYNNYMWVAAGAVAEVITKKSWEELLQEGILDALDMKHSNASLKKTLAADDFARPYQSNETSQVEIPFLDIHPANPAGGIYSNLEDMAKWLQLHLNHGKVNGKTVVPKNSLEETYKPYASMTAERGGAHYGMGWGIALFDKHTIYTHDGGVDGFTANVSFIPEIQLGIVVLMNMSNVTPQLVAFNLWQRLLELPAKDYVEESLVALKKNAEAKKLIYPDLAEQFPTRPLTDYVGDYCHPAYGKATIRLTSANLLHIEMGVVVADLNQVGSNSFQIPGVYNQGRNLTFEGDSTKIQKLLWPLENSTTTPLTFIRCP